MLETRMTQLLGIKYPIQCGTMQWLSKAELVSAVANAGGFACLAAATFPEKERFLTEIRKTRDLTDKPFGVNVSLFPSLTHHPPERVIGTVIEAGIKIVETAGRNPEPYRKQIKDAGLIHIHKCARVRDAVKADKLGVDLISIVGTECGGHPGMECITSMVLIPKAAEAISAPLIAGGGIGDGRSMMAALALGAEGVIMGTRFINTRECPVNERIKQLIIQASEADTALVMMSLSNPSRVLRNPWAERVLEMEGCKASLEELAPMIKGELSRRGWEEGHVDMGLYPVGQVIGRIKDVPGVAELITRTVEEARQVMNTLSRRF